MHDLTSVSWEGSPFKSTSGHHWSTCRKPSCSFMGDFTYGYWRFLPPSVMNCQEQYQVESIRVESTLDVKFVAHFRSHFQLFLIVFNSIKIINFPKKNDLSLVKLEIGEQCSIRYHAWPYRQTPAISFFATT